MSGVNIRGFAVVCALAVMASGCTTQRKQVDPWTDASQQALKRGRALSKQGRHADALTELESARKANASPQISIEVARTLERLERPEQACREWLRLQGDESLVELARLGSKRAQQELRTVRMASDSCWHLGRGIEHPAKGPEDALVTITEVANFNGGDKTNRRILTVLEEVGRLYGGQVRFVFLTQLGDDSQASLPPARAAMAAHLQGRFWEMHNRLMENPQALHAAAFRRFAAEIGLDVRRFAADMDRPGTTRFVLRSQRWADELGAGKPPSFFVNGAEVRGDLSARNLVAYIEPALARARELAKAQPNATERPSEILTRQANPTYARLVIEGLDPNRKTRAAEPTRRTQPVEPPRAVAEGDIRTPQPVIARRTRRTVITPDPAITPDPVVSEPVVAEPTPVPLPQPMVAKRPDPVFEEPVPDGAPGIGQPTPQPLVAQPTPAAVPAPMVARADVGPAPRRRTDVAPTPGFDRRDVAPAPDIAPRPVPRKTFTPRPRVAVNPAEWEPPERMPNVRNRRTTAGKVERLDPVGIRGRLTNDVHFEKPMALSELMALREDFLVESAMPTTLVTRDAWQIPITDDDPAIGPAGAAVTVVAFVDYGCEDCVGMGDVVATAISKARTVRLVMKMRPQGDGASRDLAYAAMVAHHMGGFWEMHKRMRDAETPPTRSELILWADDIGLDAAEFETRMEEAPFEYGDYMRRTALLGEDLNSFSAGTVYVNGHRFVPGPERPLPGQLRDVPAGTLSLRDLLSSLPQG